MEFAEDTERCRTVDRINEEHEFEVEDTPTNKVHCEFLKSMDTVYDITNHSSLFSKKE